MVVRLLSPQISQHWEIIKYVVVQTDEVKQDDLQSYLNELLQVLLSDKAQCWVRVDKNRELIALMITRIEVNGLGKKFLWLQSMYSFKRVDNKLWKTEYELIKKFAKQNQCLYISLKSKNRRVWELAECVGFKESHREFTYNLG